MDSKASLKNARFVVVPCPHEKTTSYGKGTKAGPAAILEASLAVEEFDEELKTETYKAGIHTLPPTPISRLQTTCSRILRQEKIPIVIGGEHSLSIAPVLAASEIYENLSVLQFDAHADLRDSYRGKKDSHAAIGRRILEVCPLVQVGIRNVSEEEWAFANTSGQVKKMHFAEGPINAETIVSQLSEFVYITFDVDVFDPAIMPSTGTPEPGGLLWNDVIAVLRKVCQKKSVIGADFVELMPIKGFVAPDFMVAKLIYRLMGYIGKS